MCGQAAMPGGQVLRLVHHDDGRLAGTRPACLRVEYAVNQHVGEVHAARLLLEGEPTLLEVLQTPPLVMVLGKHPRPSKRVVRQDIIAVLKRQPFL